MKVLIVGGGISGLASSIALARAGHEVSLYEREEKIEALGSGITLIGAALRSMDELGVLEDCLKLGYPIRDFDQRSPSGELVSSFTMPSATGADGPGMMGMMRPDLHRILLEHAVKLGVRIKAGRTLNNLQLSETEVTVFTDDSEKGETFDLLVGADGLNSRTREQMFGDIQPVLQNQVIYRVVLERPAELVQEVQFVGHPEVMVGFTPTGTSSMYMYCLVPAGDGDRSPEAEWPRIVREHLKPFGGIVAEVRDQVVDPSCINFTRFRTIMVPKPWRKGRAVLVGDAVHCTTPHLAAGGAMCLEDAVVLAQEVAADSSVEGALDAYTARRFDRCKLVVETSAQLSHWGVSNEASGEQVQTLIQSALGRLAGAF